MSKYDYLVVGAGLYGAVFAHEAAARGKKVLVIDKRPNIAGNVYTEEMDSLIQGVLEAGENMRTAKPLLDNIVIGIEESTSWTGESRDQLVAFLQLMQQYLNALCDGDSNPITQMENELISFQEIMEDYEQNSEAITYAKGV